MELRDFSFELPSDLIAQYPPEKRGQSRLMTLDRLTGKQEHRMVKDLPEILSGPELRGANGELPLLVFNNSKVRKARLIGISLDSGASVEFLLLEKKGSGATEEGTASSCVSLIESARREPLLLPLLPERQVCFSKLSGRWGVESGGSPIWKTLVQHSKRRKIGSRYVFYDAAGGEIARAEIVRGEGAEQADAGFRFLAFDRNIDDAWLERYGHIPLPPYIKRQDVPADADRYQTVYAAATGSAAAPTAGLHFTHELLDRIAAAGIETAFITLHVGLGTFLPVRSPHIEDHVMHSETFSIDETTAAKIETAKAEGRKIVAIGTTTARTLESAWSSPHPRRTRPPEGGLLSMGAADSTCTGTGRIFASTPLDGAMDRVPPLPTPHSLLPITGSTSIFIYPGYQFKMVDALFTNFHTPESTLLMLVSAFAGRELILESYAKAIGEGYRFFSYGDAMLIV